MKLKIISGLSGMLLLNACAAITTGTTQTVAVDTAPYWPSQCQLSNEKGTWTIRKTPASTTVHKAYGPLAVTCESPEGHSGTQSFESSTGAPVFGNILVGGLIGAAIDMGTGAAYNYPALIVVPMNKPEPVAPVPTAVSQPLPLGLPVRQPETAFVPTS